MAKYKPIRKKSAFLAALQCMIITLAVWLIEIVVGCMYYDVTQSSPFTPLILIPFAILWMIQGFVCYAYSKSTVEGGIMFAITGDIAALALVFQKLEPLGIGELLNSVANGTYTDNTAVMSVLCLIIILIMICILVSVFLFIISYIGSVIADALLNKWE